MVYWLYFYGVFLVFRSLKALKVSTDPVTCIFNQSASLKKCQPAHQELTHLHKPRGSHPGQCNHGVQYPDQGHLDMQTGGARDQTNDFWLVDDPLHLLNSNLNIYISVFTR